MGASISNDNRRPVERPLVVTVLVTVNHRPSQRLFLDLNVRSMFFSMQPPQRYDYYALETLYQSGSREVEFRCLTCPWRRVAKIEHLIGRYSPAIELFDLGRRATCSKCGRSGCFVQVVPPPAPGELGHEEYMRRAYRRYQDWLEIAKRYR